MYSLSSMAPAYLVSNCQLLSEVCRLEDFGRQADLKRLWGPMFRGLRKNDIGYEQFKRLLNICLDIEIAAHCDYLFTLRLFNFLLTYLLTYLHVQKIMYIC